MSLLNPSSAPTALLQRSLPTSTNNGYNILLSPALQNIFNFATIWHKFLSAAICRISKLALTVLQKVFYTIKIILFKTFLFLSIVFWTTKKGLEQAWWWFWNYTEGPRKRVVYEVALFLFGGGSGLVLLALWPGWLLIGGVAWGIWMAS